MVRVGILVCNSYIHLFAHVYESGQPLHTSGFEGIFTLYAEVKYLL